MLGCTNNSIQKKKKKVRKIKLNNKFNLLGCLNELITNGECREKKREIPLGPRDVRVIMDSALQASTFLRTASSRPDRCLWPSFSIDCIPCDCICNPILTSQIDRLLLYLLP